MMTIRVAMIIRKCTVVIIIIFVFTTYNYKYNYDYMAVQFYITISCYKWIVQMLITNQRGSPSNFIYGVEQQLTLCDKQLDFPFVIRNCTWFDVIFGIWWFVVLSQLSYRQDKRMDELNLFLDYHYKSIVSIIWARHVLTLHLSHANWRKLKLSHYWQLQKCSCTLCNFYQIESYHSSSKLSPFQCNNMES